MTELLWVGAGGFLGAVGRYLVNGLVYRWLPAAQLPWGTLTVNVAGCLLIGLLGAAAEARGILGGPLRLLVFIGALGGFTTFSTFAYETLALARGGGGAPAAVNVAAHMLLCLGAVWIGEMAGRLLWR